MVGFVGPLEECFVHFGLGVGGQFDEFPKQRQRVFELDVVHDLETVQVSADNFGIKRFPVMCNPKFPLAKRVSAADSIFGR